MDYEGYDLLARQNNQSSQSDITGSNRWSPQYMKEWSSYIIYQDVNNIKDKDDIFSSPLLTTTSYTQIHTLTQLQPCTTYQYHGN